MTPDRNENAPEESENGVLADSGSIDTAAFGITDAATARVDVTLPPLGAEDDDLVDDDIVLDAADRARVSAAIEDAAVEDEPVSSRPFSGETVTAEAMDDEAVEASLAESARAAADRNTVDAEVVDDTATGAVPVSRRQAFHADDKHAVERLRHPRTTEVPLQSRRLGEFEAGRETSDLLTADRLLEPSHRVRPEPEGAWQHFVYRVTAHKVNLGDGKRARARKELDRRIAAPLTGGAKFVPVLSRKGGVGKTTVTTLLGMALADAREDRVIGIDANPDRGTLAERIGGTSGKTVRDLARMRGEVLGFNDLSGLVARDETRLDVVASDADPRVSEAFNDRDYHDVAAVAAHYYSIVLTDTGTGIVHSVMEATLALSDQMVIVAGLSVDEARLAAETLTWLETNGFAEHVRNAVVVLNTSRPGAALVRADELDAHFRSRVRTVVRMPYDPHIAAGSAVNFRDLQPGTRLAARELAAAVVEGLRSLAPAA